MRAAVGLGDRRLLVGAYGADHRHAERPRPLAGDRAYSAGGRVEKNRLAAFERKRLAQKILHGEPLEHERRRHALGHAVGQLDQPIGRHHPNFRIRAWRAAAVCDAIAGLDVADAGPDCLDYTGAFAAETRRQRELIQPATLISIDVIEPDRGLAHARFAGCGIADRDLLPLQHFGTAGLVNANGMRHRLLPCTDELRPV